MHFVRKGIFEPSGIWTDRPILQTAEKNTANYSLQMLKYCRCVFGLQTDSIVYETDIFLLRPLTVSCNHTLMAFSCKSPKFLAANISVRPAVANWIFRGFVAALLGFGTQAFSVVGQTVWNSLPALRDPAVVSKRFGRDLKMHLFVGH